MMKRILRSIIIVVGIFLLLTVILIVLTVIPWLTPNPKTAFLTALLTGDEQTARHYISPELQTAAETQCPGGQITACAANLISPTWGDFEVVTFIFGSASPAAELFYASYSERWEPIAIVLLHDPKNENMVTGWRGFVISEGENSDSELLRGQRTDNQFP